MLKENQKLKNKNKKTKTKKQKQKNKNKKTINPQLQSVFVLFAVVK